MSLVDAPGPAAADIQFLQADNIGFERGDDFRDTLRLQLPVGADAAVHIVGEELQASSGGRVGSGAVRGIRALGIRGCAVSMPFKEDVIPLLDGLRDSAAAIDSVNTIVNDDGTLLGYNTDYSAVRALLEPLARAPFLLRGSGGMAKATATALVDAGFVEGVIVARNAAKADRKVSSKR